MRTSLLLLCFLTATTAFAQEFKRPYQDERKGYMEIGVGGAASKAGAAYTVSPVFLKNTRLGWQVYFAPQFIVAPRVNLGVRLGGVFRPKFADTESNSVLQGRFTPYALPFANLYLGSGGERNMRFFIGAGVGATYIGKLEARSNVNDETFYLRRRDRDIFLTVVPHAGSVFGDLKIQAEYVITTPFNPDLFLLTLSNTFPMGRRKYF